MQHFEDLYLASVVLLPHLNESGFQVQQKIAHFVGGRGVMISNSEPKKALKSVFKINLEQNDLGDRLKCGRNDDFREK